jgi:uncharacterized protein
VIQSRPSRRGVLACGAGLALMPPALSRAAPEAAATADPGRIRVAFMGDSMADGFWGSFVRMLTREKCLKDRADGGRYAKNGTGLTRADSFDWPGQARKIVETYAPAAIVISIGINDRQDVIEPGGGRATYPSPAWDAAYKGRVGALIEAATSGGAAALLVGLPAMRDTVVNTDREAKNRLFQEAVAAGSKPGLSYVEPWHPANAAPGAFTSAAPNPGGAGIVQVRAPDGIHFTAAGYDIVWAYLYPKLVANLKSIGRDLGADCPSH